MRSLLPDCIDPEQLAASGEGLAGVWPASHCQRLVAAVHRLTGDIVLELTLSQWLPGRFSMQGRIQLELELLCQRCLQPVSLALDEPFELSAASSAATSEANEDVLELDEQGQISLGSWLEDEILLRLPLVAKHPEREDCDAGMLERSTEYVTREDSEAETENPFAVLKQLKK